MKLNGDGGGAKQAAPSIPYYPPRRSLADHNSFAPDKPRILKNIWKMKKERKKKKKEKRKKKERSAGPTSTIDCQRLSLAPTIPPPAMTERPWRIKFTNFSMSGLR